jgi:hypothetical protein
MSRAVLWSTFTRKETEMTSRVTLVASLGLIHLIRRDFGINWTDFVGANTTIGDEVEITMAIEAVRTT